MERGASYISHYTVVLALALIIPQCVCHLPELPYHREQPALTGDEYSLEMEMRNSLDSQDHRVWEEEEDEEPCYPICGPDEYCKVSGTCCVCTCNPGLTREGSVCVDVDECDAVHDPCGANGICKNTHGSYVCECKHGFSGEGTTCTGDCITSLTVIAMTGSGKTAGSDDSPFLHLGLKNHERGEAIFPDNPGDDMVKNKGDIWVFEIHSFGFLKTCITREDIKWISIHAGGSNGWKIASVLTLIYVENKYVVFTNDMNIDRWIDSDQSTKEREFRLTIVPW